MKFFNIPTSITLAASLFWTFSNATIKIENLPSDVHVGATYPIAWSNDRDYQIQDFALVCWEDSMRWTSRVQTVNHYLASAKGNDDTYWKVPAVKQKNRFYSLIVIAAEVNSTGSPDFDAPLAYTTTNRFLIHGGRSKLRSEEIAGMVVASLLALALIVGALICVARYMQEERSRAAAAEMSEGSVGRYTDAAA